VHKKQFVYLTDKLQSFLVFFEHILGNPLPVCCVSKFPRHFIFII